MPWRRRPVCSAVVAAIRPLVPFVVALGTSSSKKNCSVDSTVVVDGGGLADATTAVIVLDGLAVGAPVVAAPVAPVVAIVLVVWVRWRW